MKQGFEFQNLKASRFLAGSAVPLWLWILALTSIGAFVVLLGYMESYQVKNQSESATPASGQKTEAGSKTATDSPTSTTFDFYNLLPELESIIPDRDKNSKGNQKSTSRNPKQTQQASSSTTTTTTGSTTSTATSLPISPLAGQYYLQAGSFKDFQAADSRRASLALIGIESEIQDANIPNRGLWHRVRIGPFLTLAEMRRTRKRLKNNNIDAIMLTVKK